MKCTALLFVVSLVASGALHAQDGGCLNSSIPKGQSTKVVAMKNELAAPYFYYRSFDFNYVILVSATSVSSTLQSSAQAGNKEAGNLLTLISKDLPLRETTDLFRYVLSDSYYFSLIQSLLVNLVYRGDAAVMYAPIGKLIPQITVKLDNSDTGSSRKFLGPNEVSLLWSLDCIVD